MELSSSSLNVSVLLDSCSAVQTLLSEGTENAYCLAVTRLDSIVMFLQATTGNQTTALIGLMEAATELIAVEIAGMSSPTVCSIGRPKIKLSYSQLEYLLSLRFTAKKISEYYSVSRHTVMRRMKHLNLSVRGSYTVISEEDLELTVSSVLLNFPNTGYKRMKGYLQARNIKVTDLRVRCVMRQVDPDGVYLRTLRRNQVIRRRTYYVQYSNQLWHIDGNHKLIRWGFVIRCGIDGKSRAVTYISATTNNRADTHLEAFLSGVSRYGVPLRTRSDKGGENVLIAKFMLDQRGTGRGSHICGRSVHNQRIERYWREVFEGCTATYYHLFWRLEDDGLLDIDNPAQLWLLHYVFLPRLNRHLNVFIDAWNSHPLSSESNRSPNQLMLIHLPPSNQDITLHEDDLTTAEFSCERLSDLARFNELTDQDYGIGISNVTTVLHSLSNLDVLGNSDLFGYDIYANAYNLLFSTTN